LRFVPVLQLAVAEMLRCGVTCYNDMYFFPHVSARVTSEYVCFSDDEPLGFLMMTLWMLAGMA